ncbi:MAG: BspA family leucine-rich repeat surface protein [Clostridia bacterium]|nr:BspA family leucine-rich repeat surface protein [Clostridia bacterium]
MKRRPVMLLAAILLAVLVFPAVVWAVSGSGVLLIDAPRTEAEYTVLGTSLPRSRVASVTFEDTLTAAPADAWDVSKSQDGSLLAWAVPNGSLYDLHIAGEGGVRAAQYSAGLFEGYTALQRIYFNGCFDTSGVISMDAMFKGCSSLTELDLTGFDVGRVEFMDDFFYGCSALQLIRVREDFVPPEGTNMRRMFFDCSARLVYAVAPQQPASNILRGDRLTAAEKTANTGKVFGSSIPRGQIESVAFVSSLSGMPSGAWDVSEEGDGSVMAWTEPAGEMHHLYIGANGVIKAGADTCRELFKGYSNVKTIRFDGAFDTSAAENMQLMFSGCSALTELDVSGFDTSNVRNMLSMFYGCSALTELDVSGFDTSAVETMRTMFYECSSLKKLNVSGFNTSNVTSMRSMFYGCGSLTELDVSGFDTSAVESMGAMFYECSRLEQLDVSGFDTGRVTDMADVFNGCGSLTELDVSGFNTEAATTMQGMFCECFALKQLDVSGFSTAGVTDMSFMFYKCNVLRTLDVSGFDTSAVETMSAMFYECSRLEQLDVSGFDTGRVIDMAHIFYGCGSLTALDVTGFDTSSVATMHDLFSGCSALTELNVSGFDTGSAADMSGMFSGCSALTYLDLTGFDTAGVSNMSNMFENCTALANILVGERFVIGQNTETADMFTYCKAGGLTYLRGDSNILRGDEGGTVLGSEIPRTQIASVTFADSLSGMTEDAWDASAEGDRSVMAWTEPNGELYDLYIGANGVIRAGANTCRGLFKGYSNAKIIRFGGCFDTSGAADMSFMFSECRSLTELDVSGFRTGGVTDLSGMFSYCSGLRNLDVSGFDTRNVLNMEDLFFNCSALEQLDVSGFDTASVTDMSWMFARCGALTELDITGFDTANVGDMAHMFEYSGTLTRILVGKGFVIGTKTDTGSMFANCGVSGLTRVSDGGTLRHDMLTVRERMNNAGAVMDSGIPRTQIAEVRFVNSLEGMPEDAWDVSVERNGSVMAWTEPNGGLYNLFIGSYGTIRADTLTCRDLFSGYSSAQVIDFGGIFDTSAAKDMACMFSGCSSLTQLDVRGFDTSNAADMREMFYHCFELRDLDVSGFDTSNVTNMRRMFCSCGMLKLLDVSGFNTSRVTDMSYMFYSCVDLNTLDTAGFDTSNVVDFSYMFGKCSSLKGLNLTGFHTVSAQSMNRMFNGCSSLRQLTLPGFVTEQVADMSGMFGGCQMLKSIQVREGFVIHPDANDEGMFLGCGTHSLTRLPDEGGVLRSDMLTAAERQYHTGKVLGSDIYRAEIASVSFVASLSGMTDGAWDVSEAGDGSVMAWAVPDGEMYHLYIGANGSIRAGRKTCRDLFCDYSGAEVIRFGGLFNTGDAEDFSYMFSGCSSLTELNLFGFNARSAEIFKDMLSGCGSLLAVSAPNGVVFDANATIAKGMSGDRVSIVQEALSHGGYLSGSVDGIFGSGTESAVKKFQKDARLDETGVVDGSTMAALLLRHWD